VPRGCRKKQRTRLYLLLDLGIHLSEFLVFWKYIDFRSPLKRHEIRQPPSCRKNVLGQQKKNRQQFQQTAPASSDLPAFRFFSLALDLLNAGTAKSARSGRPQPAQGEGKDL